MHISHLLGYSREGGLLRDVSAIMDCCLARGPSYERAFQLLRYFWRNAAMFSRSGVELPRLMPEVAGFSL